MDFGNVGLLVAGVINLAIFIKGLSIGSWIIGFLGILSLIILVATFFSEESD